MGTQDAGVRPRLISTGTVDLIGAVLCRLALVGLETDGDVVAIGGCVDTSCRFWRWDLLVMIYSGPEIPCLRIIRKCISMNVAVSRGRTKVCRL
jgi:hypothetical protein